MLLNLHVKNLALIEEVDVDFEKGLIVLTGETGAGKSLILGSENIALGNKASKDMIRKGTDYSLVELTFSVSENCAKQLKKYDIYRSLYILLMPFGAMVSSPDQTQQAPFIFFLIIHYFERPASSVRLVKSIHLRACCKYLTSCEL